MSDMDTSQAMEDSDARTRHSPGDINLISEEEVRQRALAVLTTESAATQSLPQLAVFVTNALLDRAFRVVWKLEGQVLGSWSKQRALAKLVASLSGRRLPSWANAERPGQRMHEFVTRYQERRRKLLEAERRASRRAKGKAAPPRSTALRDRVALEEDIFVCRYGCTPTTIVSIRHPPAQGLQRVEWAASDVMVDNLKLQNENAALKRLETDAVKSLEVKLRQKSTDLLSSVSTEDKAFRELERVRKRAREAEEEKQSAVEQLVELSKEKSGLQRSVKDKDDKLLCLGAKVARAHLDLASEMQARRKLEQSLNENKKAVKVANGDIDRLQVQLEEMLRLKEVEVEAQSKKYAGIELRLGAHVTRLNSEMACLQRHFDFEKMQLVKERVVAEERLEKISDEVERLRRLKNEMAKKKRAAESKANTSSRRLERAQEAETAVIELQQEYDELHEEVEAIRSCGAEYGELEGRQSSASILHPEGKNGQFTKYPWELRLLIYKWLLRRTPPSAIAGNLIDAVRTLAPNTYPASSLRAPDISTIRRMRQEATLLGEVTSAYRIATCRRVVSFGFDETTKFGDGLASANFQLETKEGEICDEVLRGAFLIPGGCADQVAAAMESKLFVRGRFMLNKWKEIHEKQNGQDSWPAPKASRLGYHRLARAVILSDTCNGAQAAKRRIVEQIAEEVEWVHRENGTWRLSGHRAPQGPT